MRDFAALCSVAVIIHFLFLLLTSAYSLTLEDAFREAKNRSEKILMEEQESLQAESRVSQALGRLFPNLGLVGTYQRQQSSSDLQSPFLREEQTTVKLALTQPLFHGFGEFAEYESRKALLRAAHAKKRMAEIELYSSTATTFYGVLAAEKEVSTVEKLLELTRERERELRDRVRIGRSRKSELLAAEAQAGTLEAQQEVTRTSLAKAKEMFLLTTGLSPIPSLEGPPSDSNASPAKNIDELLRHMEARPDIVAKKEQLTSRQEGIRVARSGHFPSLDLNANYYLKRSAGLYENIHWDVGLSLVLPLFQGGVITSGVKEAFAARKESELDLELHRRSVSKEIRTTHALLEGLVKQFAKLRRATGLAEANYKEQSREYRFGLVTNLEVLQSLNQLYETQRLLDQVYFNMWQTAALLRAQVGQIP